MKIFWTEAALEAEVARRLYFRATSQGANFDPERIPSDAILVAIAAYHGVGLPAIREDSYFIRPMRAALQAFGRHILRGDWASDPQAFIPVSTPGEVAPKAWDVARIPSSLRDRRAAP